MKLNLARRAKKRLPVREPQSLSALPVLNRVWALDFMRDTLYDGRPFRTLNVIDEGGASLHQRSRVGTLTPNSTDRVCKGVLSGGSILATACSLNFWPYRAIGFPRHLAPL
ncbi:MAG: hypothetical protein Q4D91_11165 [Lautropia sp.]|nr:hypothetical protein [Lautropia sp.]